MLEHANIFENYNFFKFLEIFETFLITKIEVTFRALEGRARAPNEFQIFHYLSPLIFRLGLFFLLGEGNADGLR